MASVNKTILVGNVGKDCETSISKGGTNIAKFSMATSKKVKGEFKTTWHNIVAFGKLADICGLYIKKGMMVYIEGELEIENYTDKDGNKRTSVSVIAYQMQMLDKKEGASKSTYDAPKSMADADDTPDF